MRSSVSPIQRRQFGAVCHLALTTAEDLSLHSGEVRVFEGRTQRNQLGNGPLAPAYLNLFAPLEVRFDFRETVPQISNRNGFHM